jgi:hypothetical protein
MSALSYVRNDPVNLVDPDGKLVSCPLGWTWNGSFCSPPPAPFSVGWGPNPGEAFGIAIGLVMSAPLPHSPTPVEGLQLVLNALSRSDLEKRLGIGTLPGPGDSSGLPCRRFIDRIIAFLGDKLPTGFSSATLFTNILSVTKTAKTVAEIGHNAFTYPNAIDIAADPIDSMGNDYISTLLHEGFHIAASGRILDADLAAATSAADGTRYQGGSLSEFNKQMFGQNCQPGNH